MSASARRKPWLNLMIFLPKFPPKGASLWGRKSMHVVLRESGGPRAVISGASTAQVTPDPIPNSEVKLREADDSWTQLGPAKVSQCRLCKNPSKEGFLLSLHRPRRGVSSWAG